MSRLKKQPLSSERKLSIRRISNPPNPYAEYSYEWLDVPPAPKQEIFEERARAIISENDSPDVGFRFSVNPYRGCHHGCSYCYARPTHEYLDFGAGTDFERKIVVKINAPELLEEAFRDSSWQGDRIVFSGVTDCYQPLEAHYGLTQRCLEVCRKFKNPLGIITKGALIRRDIRLLQELNTVTSVKIFVSLAFADDMLCRTLEPYTPLPSTRLKVLQELADAGLTVGIAIAPVIPGLNDIEIPEILQRASCAGATLAFMTLLRLPSRVEEVFIERLRASLPARAEKVLRSIRRMRGGALNSSEFGMRMVGTGKEWEAVRWLFHSSCERLGMNRDDLLREADQGRKLDTFERPGGQLRLF